MEIEKYQCLPIPVEILNGETLGTFKDTDEGKDLTECKDADDMFDRLGI